MKGTVQFNGSCSGPFEIRSGVKQGCVLAPTLFGICIGLVLKHAFDTTEGIYLRTRSDGRLFNHARIRAKTNARKVLIRDMLFAGDAGVATHTQEELHSLMDCFSQACKDFGLTVSLKKTNVLEQDTEALPVITIDNYKLDVVRSSPTSAPPPKPHIDVTSAIKTAIHTLVFSATSDAATSQHEMIKIKNNKQKH